MAIMFLTKKRMKTYDIIYLAGAILVILIFAIVGFNLTTATIALIFLMLCAASGRFSVNGMLFWPFHLLLAGTVALLTLNHLYNPSKNVFTNVDHHLLSFEGYESSKDTIYLIGNNNNQPIWSNKDLGGTVSLNRLNDKLTINYSTPQPIYQKISATVDSLVNGEEMPSFDKEFTLNFNNENLSLSVVVKDSIRPNRYLEAIANKFSPQRRGSCMVFVTFLKNDSIIGKSKGNYQQFIRRSLPLYDIINDIPFPDCFNVETGVLQGITLLRKVAGANIESTHPSHFYLAFSPLALSHIKTIKTKSHTYTRDMLTCKGTFVAKDGAAYKIGTGLHATSYIHPEVRSNKLTVMLDAPLRHTLPLDKDSINNIHTAIITSNYQNLASAPTPLALNYPVFPQLKEDKQFYLGIEYLPEETLVPLSCKILPISDDKILFSSPNGSSLLKDGDVFTLNKDSRTLSPIFKFVNIRNTVPFSTTKGYLLIVAALLGAFISMLLGGRKYETRGETIVWISLIALLVFRSFLAWRASVFPPLDNFSITSFETYVQDRYTFVATLVGVAMLCISLIVYKLGHSSFVKHPQKGLLRIIALLSILLLGGMVLNERVRAVYAPVVTFFLIEWCYAQYATKIQFKWKFARYLAMLAIAAYALIVDSGFGIVFTLFLLLYNAFEHYLNWNNIKENNKTKYGFLVIILIVLFALFMYFGIYLVPFVYQHFVLFCIILTCAFIGIAYFYYKNVPSTVSAKWKWIPICIIVVLPFIFAFKGKSYLDGHRHLLYRSEVHIKPMDEIIKDEKVNTRDLERLFQASQNRWYLNYYTQELPNTKDAPYELRSHFNKGITWHTQKTDAVLGRYVIGEHSIWAAYALLLMFFILLPTIFSSSESSKQLKYRKLLGIGAGTLLLCQAIFITLAVTNRFIFFGQDYPLVSIDSALTVLLTFSLLAIIALSTLSVISEDNGNYLQKKKSYLFDKKPMMVLCILFLLTLIPGRTLFTKAGKAFNVGEAIKEAKVELSYINNLMSEYQRIHANELVKLGIIKESDDIQNNYSAFIDHFDKEYSIGDSLLALSKRPNSGISPFSASLYLLYRDKLSRDNNSTDIIHLRKHSNGLLEFNINNGYYQLTTPESNMESWQGNIIPENTSSDYSFLSLQRNSKLEQLTIGSGSARIDNLPDISYDYPMYLAKIDNDWILDGSDYYVVGKEYQKVVIKSGAKQYYLTDASEAAHYLCARSGDLIETCPNGKYAQTYGIFIKGDQNKFFARNMLVNGKRTMIYPLEEKFFYPYHLTQMVNATLSGKDKNKQKRDIILSLSYPLTEKLFDDLNKFSSGSMTYAHSVIVADGDGHIKAFVTAKNENQPSGYVYVNPNDYEMVSKYQNRFYLTGDVMNEQRAFGDLNMTYLQPGPGSSIKPITFTAVMSQAHANWEELQLYVNVSDQKLITPKDENTIETKRYAGRYLPFLSVKSDEIGDYAGLTNIFRYIQKSSNYYNSLMVYLGFYEGSYISQELNKIRQGEESLLFKRYDRNDTISNFPAFKYANHVYSFRHWLTDDGLPRHENGALQIGYEKNFRLWKEEPKTLFDKDITESVDIYSDDDLKDSLRLNYSFAYPAISYLPEKERITRQGAHDAIRNTSLGASPFQITPFKMAEMYGKLFSQNRKFRLTVNPGYNAEYEPFIIDKKYENDSLYEYILSYHLFSGMAAVSKIGGTAGDRGDNKRLTMISEELEKKGYYIYAKTGTIGNALLKTNNQLLAVVITKGALNGIEKKKFNELTRKHKFYVAYFVTENSYHDYSVIQDALKTIINSNAFINYMNKNNEKEK